MNNDLDHSHALSIAWKYFQQHAEQRIKYFNFFVLFSSLLVTAFVASLEKEFAYPVIGIVVGILQICVTFVFWKIDERNKFLTRIGEDAIKEIEKNYPVGESGEGPIATQIFTLEQQRTDKLRDSEKQKCFLFRQMSHSKCYLLIYTLFGIVGVLVFLGSIYVYFGRNPSILPATAQNHRAVIVIERKKISDCSMYQTTTVETMQKEKTDTQMTQPISTPIVPAGGMEHK